MTRHSLTRGLKAVLLTGAASALSFGAFADTEHVNHASRELINQGFSWYPADTGSSTQSAPKEHHKVAAKDTKTKNAEKNKTDKAQGSSNG
jgi:hypothetical protein